MGAWIEIWMVLAIMQVFKSHPTMGAWIEIQNYYNVCYVGGQGSHPTMGAWIEMPYLPTLQRYVVVAPHDGCVDWNTY